MGRVVRNAVNSGRPTSDKLVVLLGAGASVEAGLATSARLTELIYNDLTASRVNQEYAQLLGYVISKLQTRNTKTGLSPYTPIEVEELFDALNLLYRRDTLLLSEFVDTWDRDVENTYITYDKNAIRNVFERLVSDVTRGRSRGAFLSSAFSSDYEKLAKALRPVSAARLNSRGFNDPQRPFFASLIKLLAVDTDRTDYLSPLVNSSRVSLIATLNYDLTVEKACERAGREYDYGLTKWSQQKRVEWAEGSAIRLLKMHGSINWVGEPEDPVVKDEPTEYEKRVMVFGGIENKLSAAGPFLQFLSRFERALLMANSLLVVGYSFRDAHINAVIQRWRLTRRSSKMAVVDPSPPPLWHMGFQESMLVRKVGGRESRYDAKVRFIKTTASDGISQFFDQKDLFDHDAGDPVAGVNA